MNNSAKAKLAILGSSITALILVACGGGGTSSGAGAGGSAVASVSGTVNGGSAKAIEMRPGVGPAQLIAAIGDLVISVAHAAGLPNVEVVVTCPELSPYQGFTDARGKFKILTPEVSANTVCTTTFDGAAGPTIPLSPDMETEIEVTLAGNTVNLVGVEQRVNDQPELEIEVDDGNDDANSDGISSDGVASNDDDDSQSIDDDSQSIDQADNDDQSSDDTSGGSGTG